MKAVEKIAHILYAMNCFRKPCLVLNNVEKTQNASKRSAGLLQCVTA